MSFTPIDLTITTDRTPFVLIQTSNGSIALPATSSLAGSISLVGPSSLKGIEAYASGTYDSNEIVVATLAPYAFTISLQNSVAQSLAAATAQTIFIVNKTVGVLTTQIGTITFDAGSKEGIVAITDPDIAKRDLITIKAPAISDATLGDVVFILAE